YAGRVTSGALGSEDIGLPSLAILCQDRKFAVADELQGMEMLGASNDMCGISGRLCNNRRHAHFPDGPCVRLLLPRRTDHTLMAKQALVSGHVVRQGLSGMVAPGWLHVGSCYDRGFTQCLCRCRWD